MTASTPSMAAIFVAVEAAIPAAARITDRACPSRLESLRPKSHIIVTRQPVAVSGRHGISSRLLMHPTINMRDNFPITGDAKSEIDPLRSSYLSEANRHSFERI